MSPNDRQIENLFYHVEFVSRIIWNGYQTREGSEREREREKKTKKREKIFRSEQINVQHSLGEMKATH